MTEETSLKKTVREYLTIQGWFIFPILQGLGAYPGISDLIAVKVGQVLFIELKSKKGKQSEAQQQFQESIEKSGGIYLLVRSLDDLILELR